MYSVNFATTNTSTHEFDFLFLTGLNLFTLMLDLTFVVVGFASDISNIIRQLFIFSESQRAFYVGVIHVLSTNLDDQ